MAIYRGALALGVACLTLLSPAAHADAVGDVVVVDGQQYEVRGVTTGTGGGRIVAAGLETHQPSLAPSCRPAGVTITIGDLTATTLLSLSNGDIYYRWTVPTSVHVRGSCDSETINRQVYVDQPLVTTGTGYVTPATSPVYETRVTGNAVAQQSPEWMVLYYSPANLATRAIFGSLTARVHAAYVVAPGFAGAGSERAAGCREKVWYFWATPTGPQIDSSLTREGSCA